MRNRLMVMALVIGIAAAGGVQGLAPTPSAEAQGVKTTGLKRASRVEIAVTNTTESGLGYTAFKTVLDELLRIADEFIVGLYQKYR